MSKLDYALRTNAMDKIERNLVKGKKMPSLKVKDTSLRLVTIDETNNSSVVTGDNQVIGTVFEGTDGRYQYLSTDWTVFANFNDAPLLSEIVALY